MTQTDINSLTVTTSFRNGESWADQAESPGWVAKAPPIFSEEVPEIVLCEKEFEPKPPKQISSTLSVYVGGLDYSLESKDLEEFFKGKGCRVTRVRVLKQNGKSSGKAFMNVADKEALEEVLKLNGSKLSGRQIVVREDLGVKQTRSTRTDTTSDMGGRWREDPKPAKNNHNGWSTVGKAPSGVVSEYISKKKVEKKEVQVQLAQGDEVPEIPKERKKLELKPRSRPLGEIPEITDSSRSEAIFGKAKPRDQPILKEEPEATSETPVVKRREKKPEAVAVVVLPEPASVFKKPVIKKRSNNRFMVEDSETDETTE